MAVGLHHPLRRRLAATIGLLAVVAGVVLLAPPTPAVAAGTHLSLTPGSVSWKTIGARRTSSSATVTVSVPDVLPVRFGLQVRAGSHNSGYRATLAIEADGTVTGAIGRVRSGNETILTPATPLGVRVAPGDAIRLDVAVAASKRVWVYLKAGPVSSVPANWQLAAGDASSSRLTTGGRTYLWAAGSGGDLDYRGASAKATTAAKAAAVGVVPPEPGDDTFSIAVIPDTQVETNIVSNKPFLNRMNWLVANAGPLDLRYVLHTGDVTNWGWLDPPQFERAAAAFRVLADGGLPYAVAIGNHDTEVVGWNGREGSTGYGGAAFQGNPLCAIRFGADACRSGLLVRNTNEFNQWFPLATMGGLAGAFQDGRSDNYWTTFTANGTQWLVLTLELWPRREVVDWAGGVVADHPDHNVIIQTHSYLDAKGRIGEGAGGYGATSPQYLYQHVVATHANVKLVFSGHTGKFLSRTDSPGGNTVVSYLGNELPGSGHNPVRTVSINTRTGAVFSLVHDPLTQKVVSATNHVIDVIR